MMGAPKKQVADVCLLLEGTFPYVAGGVSTWVNDLLRAQQDLTFHIVTILADRTPRERRYQLPPNVLELEHVYLHDNTATGGRAPRNLDQALIRMEPALIKLQNGGGLDEIAQVKATLDALTPVPGREVLLNSPQAWELLQRMYRATVPHCSFLDYFWTWRAQLGGLFAVLSADLPPAKVYHTISTGYAGLMAARAKLETGRPTIITEHGIYTNERRIEITMAEWLSRRDTGGFSVGRERTDLRDLWINTFLSYSKACYGACDRIITLFGGNQILQRTDGAPVERLEVIPNGIDYDRLSVLPRDPNPHPPTVAFIGRVVSIKDVKTFIRAIALLRKWLPDVKAYILGPTEEEEGYHRECLAMCAELNLENTLEFTGRVNLNEWFGRIDVIALTSVSEAQPLVILEAGAAGIPTVATDVGACREMLLGRPDENPKLGAGGVITPLASPSATARGLADLLLDDKRRARYGVAIKARVERYYNKHVIDHIYHGIYDDLRQLADVSAPQREAV